MVDAAALTLGMPASALPDAALAAAGLPSAHQMAADSLATDRALDPPSYSTDGTGDSLDRNIKLTKVVFPLRT